MQILLTLLIGLVAIVIYAIIFLGIESLVDYIVELYNQYIFNKYNEWPGLNWTYFITSIMMLLLAFHFIYIIGHYFKNFL